MRILWFSNAPWAPTGYGQQTAQVVPRLVADGHDVAIAANHGLAGGPLKWRGVPVLPQGFDQFSNDILRDHFDAFSRGEPAALITLYDVWPIHLERLKGVPTASWVPVDHVPVPPDVQTWCRDRFVIAMSQFGVAQFAAAGIRARYVPHAVEPDFAPRSDADRSALRERMGIPADAFLIMINAANLSKVVDRKAWSEMFLAVARLQSEHPDVYLYVHTDPVNPGGMPLDILAVASGLDGERCRWAQPYRYRSGLYEPEDLANFYAAADVLLSTSLGEGFGLAVIEAQACGTPVIVNDFSAQPELCGAGWTVRNQPFWDKTQGAWFGLPLVADIYAKLVAARESRGDSGLRERAVAFAQQYGADAVFAGFWRPVLEELDAILQQPAIHEPTPANRAERRRAARQQRPKLRRVK